MKAGEVVKDRLVQLATFEGPDSYWSIEAIHDPESDTHTVWICNSNREPVRTLAANIGRWESFARSWDGSAPGGELQPDILDVYTEEAEGFLQEAWLQESVLVLEDQSGGKLCQRALLGGGPDEYTVVAKDLEAGREWEKVMDRTQAAEMIAGWTVVERRRNARPQFASKEDA